MHEQFVPYYLTILAMGATGALLLVQLVVVDVAGMRAGHSPGAPIPTDHGSFLFRAGRAHANTNESVAAFVLLALFGMFTGASPGWLNGLAITYAAARLSHMVCYYAGVQILRSVSFGAALVALVGMLLTGLLS
ncbi:MAG: MAPEG family protein [Candidatus Binatia bacterium]